MGVIVNIGLVFRGGIISGELEGWNDLSVGRVFKNLLKGWFNIFDFIIDFD